jgi:hypothetical protein
LRRLGGSFQARGAGAWWELLRCQGYVQPSQGWLRETLRRLGRNSQARGAGARWEALRCQGYAQPSQGWLGEGKPCEG